MRKDTWRGSVRKIAENPVIKRNAVSVTTKQDILQGTVQSQEERKINIKSARRIIIRKRTVIFVIETQSNTRAAMKKCLS